MRCAVKGFFFFLFPLVAAEEQFENVEKEQTNM